ncbi:DUF2569 domain-containing protein [Reinekea blandensis]|uniref:DUF2569 domain-containing protein n=1 Tax=Reinekea blandensis MED297 TaxID=314283 RepID=A4BHQ4_9GAMM|nr:DUF2569 domain-containing protein [Reinekea blandensis]EAR08309.1 hypothetical protein MED297_09221 [Reinekea sp. MED297] [Reinekea blandensis MED297]
MNERNDLQGLGGWLILIGIGVVIGPFRTLFTFGPIYYGIFTDGTFGLLTSQWSEFYHPLWAPVLIGETLYNSLMLIVSVVMIYLFFTKHYLFPKVYIAVVVVSLVFIPLDSWLLSFILPGEPMFGPEALGEFARTLVVALIWIPYMLISKRVKATFVEKMPQKPMSFE